MRRLVVSILFVVLSSGYARAADGQALFVSYGCDKCHAVSTHGIKATAKSEKMRGPDLAEASPKHDAAWIVRLVTKEELVDGKKHKGSFKGSDEDLAAIAEWVAGLKGN